MYRYISKRVKLKSRGKWDVTIYKNLQKWVKVKMKGNRMLQFVKGIETLIGKQSIFIL